MQSKIFITPVIRNRFVRLLTVIVATFTLLAPVIAHASSVSEQFTSVSTIKPGLLVSSTSEQDGNAELATIKNSKYLLGVVTSSKDSTLTLGKAGAEVTVAKEGVVATYVTDANGGIKKGDLIGASWIEGIGMIIQTDNTNQKILGVAQEDFSPSEGVDFNDIDTPGGSKTVKVGSIAVRLAGPDSQSAALKQAGLSGVAARLVGKDVSMARIVAAILIFAFAFGICAAFIRNSIKHSFISLGRNPLASKSIFRALAQVSLVSAGVILVATAVAYAVVVVG